VSLLSAAKRYTNDHEWVEFDTTTGQGAVSITDYAQKSLGDVVFVELPTVGAEFAKGGPCSPRPRGVHSPQISMIFDTRLHRPDRRRRERKGRL
jgi:hypothetical protein